MQLRYLGHSCFEFTSSAGTRLIVDPFLDDNPHAAISADEVEADLILVTHGGFDHLGDAFAIAKRTGAMLFASGDVAIAATLEGIPRERAFPMVSGAYRGHAGFWVQAVDVRHVSITRLSNGGFLSGQPLAFVISEPDDPGGAVVHHGGDSSLFTDMKLIAELYKPTVALVGIGGDPDLPHEMTPEQGAIAASWLGVERAVPMHWLPTGDDGPRFAEAVQRTAPGIRVDVMTAGDRLDLDERPQPEPASATPATADVIVAGGGPVGMLLAAELGTLGVDTVVVEPHPCAVDQPRAGVMHFRTVQSLVRRGFIDADPTADPHDEVSQGYPFAGAPGLTMRAPATEGPPMLRIPQLELERRFESRARDVGARILREYRVLSVSDEGDHVAADVVGPAGPTRITASYLVGADGARSTVRRSLGFESESWPSSLAALIGRVRVVDPEGAPEGWRPTPRGWTRIDLVPDGHSRVMTFDFDGPAADRHAPVSLDELQDTFARIWGATVEFTDPRFLGRFSDYSRLVTEYRRDRVFLAGDAAHVHFPIGGQGLNLGIQDAFNLGWKIAAALQADPDDGLLDSYFRERHPIARRVLDHTRAQVTLMHPGPDFIPLRSLFAELLELDCVSRHLSAMVSAQEIRQPWSGREGDFQTNIELRTERGSASLAELLAAARPLVVLLPGSDPAIAEIARPWAGHVTTVAATCGFPLPWRSALIRPDGYLAWTARDGRSDAGALAATLAEWFGPPGGKPPARTGRQALGAARDG